MNTYKVYICIQYLNIIYIYIYIYIQIYGNVWTKNPTHNSQLLIYIYIYIYIHAPTYTHI